VRPRDARCPNAVKAPVSQQAACPDGTKRLTPQLPFSSCCAHLFHIPTGHEVVPRLWCALPQKYPIYFWWGSVTDHLPGVSTDHRPPTRGLPGNFPQVHHRPPTRGFLTTPLTYPGLPPRPPPTYPGVARKFSQVTTTHLPGVSPSLDIPPPPPARSDCHPPYVPYQTPATPSRHPGPMRRLFTHCFFPWILL
jgi:hypothetical protein